MGQNWFKNRPKTLLRVKAAAVNLDDLEIASNTLDLPINASETLIISETGVASDSDSNAHSTANATASSSVSAGVSDQDQVLLAFQKLSRNPFEPSPFEKLFEKVGRTTENTPAGKVVKIKPTKILAVPFKGLIETENELLAILDKKLYKAGQIFQDKTIKRIGTGVVTLEDPAGIYLIPKNGVKIDLASDGFYTYEDTLPTLKF